MDSTPSNYRKKYVHIYLWQAISVLLGFASLFVVIPYLSSDKILYGTYSVCTSLTIFFTYADLGFLGAGAKYSAEYYIRGDLRNEIKTMGFTAFLMMAIFLIIDAGLLYVAFNPNVLIPEIALDSQQYRIAQNLLFILVLGCPLIIAQRILQIIYMIRVEDYKYQRIAIIGNIVKISSVLYFFGDKQYRIVEYYGFFQLVNLLIVVIALVGVRRYGYQLREFFKSFKFDKKIFDSEKALSFASFAFMISMMIYNEFDQIAISNLYGIEAVAVYAAAFSLMTFVRTYSSVLYSPYSSRYNHYTGLHDIRGLINFTKRVIMLIGPILVVPIFCFALLSEPFVVSWLGNEYRESGVLVSWLVMSYSVNGVTQPLSQYMTAREKNKEIALGAILSPLIYWSGIMIFSQFINVKSFAIMKFASPVVLSFYYWHVITSSIREEGYSFFSPLKLIPILLPSMVAAVLITWWIKPIMFYTHDSISLIYNFLIIGCCAIVCLAITLLTNKELQKLTKSLYDSTKRKFQI